MAKRSSSRSGRTTQRKKKKSDPTLLIISLVGFGFLLILAVVYFATKSPPVAKTKRKPPAETLGQRPRPEKNTTKKRKPRIPASPRPEKDTGNLSAAYDPSCILSLPDQIALPTIEKQQTQITEISFPPESKLKLDLQLHNGTAGDRITILAKEPTAKKHDDQIWRIIFAEAKDEIATIHFNSDGATFRWSDNAEPAIVTPVHNARLIIRSGPHRKSLQLRQEQLAPSIRLFDGNSDREYEMTLSHVPDNPLENISWDLYPISPDLEPFNIKQIGPCTTGGAVPLNQKLEWSPVSSKKLDKGHGLIQFRYTFHWITGPAEAPHAIALILNVKKQYQIGAQIRADKWNDLTTKNIKADYYKVVERYETIGTKYDELRKKLDPLFIKLGIKFNNPLAIELMEKYILFPFQNPQGTSRDRERIKERRDQLLDTVRTELDARRISKSDKSTFLKLLDRFIDYQDQMLEIRELEGKYYELLNEFYHSLNDHDMRLELTTATTNHDSPIRLASYPTAIHNTPDISKPVPPAPQPDGDDEGWTIPSGSSPFAGRFHRLQRQKGSGR